MQEMPILPYKRRYAQSDRHDPDEPSKEAVHVREGDAHQISLGESS